MKGRPRCGSNAGVKEMDCNRDSLAEIPAHTLAYLASQLNLPVRFYEQKQIVLAMP